MGHIIKLTDQGEARFYEAIGGGTSKISVKAPAALAADFSITWPSALPVGTEFLTLSSTGVIATASGASTLQQAYDNGPNIVLDTDPIGLSQANNNSVITIAKTGAGAGILLDLDNDGTGKAIYLKQDGLTAAGGSVHLECTINNTSAPVLTVAKTASGGGNLLQISNDGTGDSLRIANTANGGAVSITKTAAGAGVLLNLDNDGTGTTLNIDNSANAIGMLITKTGTGAGNALHVINQGSGRACQIEQSGVNALALRVDSTQNFDVIQVNKTGTGAGEALTIIDAGTGTGIEITKSANGNGITITKTGTGAGVGLLVDNDGTGLGISIVQDGAQAGLNHLQNGAALAFQLVQTQNFRGIFLNKTGAGAGVGMEIDNDGTAASLLLNQDGEATALSIDMASGLVSAAVTILHNAAGDVNDILGTSSTWRVTNKGNIRGNRLSDTRAAKTIAAGAIEVTLGGFIQLTGEGGAADNLDNITSNSNDPVTDGQIIFLQAANDAVTITVRDNATSGGNIFCGGGGRALDSNKDILMLKFDSVLAVWLEVAFASNA